MSIQMQGAATEGPPREYSRQTNYRKAEIEVTAEMRNVGQYLRHKADLKLRVGVLDGKRVDYFKGALSRLLHAHAD